jgi:hypothetical protein
MGEIVKGQNILERVVETYASFHSYSDTGTVDSADRVPIEFPFQTAVLFNWLSIPNSARPGQQKTTIWSDATIYY